MLRYKNQKVLVTYQNSILKAEIIFSLCSPPPPLSEFFMPGLIDTHIHAPQYSFAGTRADLPLLQWLKEYTFPVEAKFKEKDFAEEVYTRTVVSKSPAAMRIAYIFFNKGAGTEGY